MKVKSESEVAQSCLTLSDPMDCSLPGSSVHGSFQARVLEWAAIAFSAREPNETETHMNFTHKHMFILQHQTSKKKKREMEPVDLKQLNKQNCHGPLRQLEM